MSHDGCGETRDVTFHPLNRRAFLERQVAHYQAQLDEIAAYPDEPGVGSVITFTKRFSGRNKYDYTAVRTTGGLWFCTGQERGGRTWISLMEFINNKETETPVIQMASGWTVL